MIDRAWSGSVGIGRAFAWLDKSGALIQPVSDTQSPAEPNFVLERIGFTWFVAGHLCYMAHGSRDVSFEARCIAGGEGSRPVLLAEVPRAACNRDQQPLQRCFRYLLPTLEIREANSLQIMKPDRQTNRSFLQCVLVTKLTCWGLSCTPGDNTFCKFTTFSWIASKSLVVRSSTRRTQLSLLRLNLSSWKWQRNFQ